MKMPKMRRPLNEKQRRELKRMRQSLGSLSRFLGEKSEESAKDICSALLSEGKIKNFWRIPPDSALDRQGIDIICETDKGFFFLNVKKSSSGVSTFIGQRRILQVKSDFLLHIIYPWRVVIESNRQEEAKINLEKILDGNVPSRNTLSEEMKLELANPTYPGKQKDEPGNVSDAKRPIASLKKKKDEPGNASDIKRPIASLKKKLERFIESKSAEHIWEICLSVKIGNDLKEIKGYGRKREEAERSAYEAAAKELDKALLQQK